LAKYKALIKFKGLKEERIFEPNEEIEDLAFETGEQIYFAADGVGVVGIGIETARVLDSEDFNGVALQGAGKYGKYIPVKNQKAILKATLTAPVPAV